MFDPLGGGANHVGVLCGLRTRTPCPTGSRASGRRRAIERLFDGPDAAPYRGVMRRLSLEAASRATGFNTATLATAVREGRLQATRRADPRVPVGGRYQIDAADLASFERAHPWTARHVVKRTCRHCGAVGSILFEKVRAWRLSQAANATEPGRSVRLTRSAGARRACAHAARCGF
jgi:hypothetical protein